MPVLATLRAGMRHMRAVLPDSLAGARSYQLLLLGAQHPLRERLTVGPRGQVVAGDAFDVVGQVGGRRLQAAQLAPETRLLPRLQGQPATEVDLEALHHGAVRSGHQLALQPDVGDLAARAFVSTIASLQNSMPVQAMVPRRHTDGFASSPMVRSSATTCSTEDCPMSRTSSFW